MKLYFTAAICAALITGCSSSSSDSDNSNGGGPGNVLTGVFLDSAVSGISYLTESQSGSTNDDGEFLYLDGETVTFSIGDLTFPVIRVGTVVTPLDMSLTSQINDNIVINASRLLQTLDVDGDTSNGIQISEQAASIATQIDFSADPTEFSQNPNVINLVANSGSSTTSLISTEEAIAHLEATLDDIGFVQITDLSQENIFGKQLQQDANFIILNSDGNLTGTWGDEPVVGTWEMRDGFWCRTYSEFYLSEFSNVEECHLWERNGNRIRATRDSGNGTTYPLTIVE